MGTASVRTVAISAVLAIGASASAQKDYRPKPGPTAVNALFNSKRNPVDYWEDRVHEVSRKLFGRRLTDQEYASLVGAPFGAKVKVDVFKDTLSIKMIHPLIGSQRSVFRSRSDGVLVLRNEHTRASSDAPVGLGTAVLARQVRAARSLGIRRISLNAGAGGDENGYYTWARLGFNGELDNGVRARLPPHLADVKDLNELMERPDGPAWWKEHGGSTSMSFDLDPQSESSRRHDRYVRERGLEPKE
jgi:hypothetical protein